MATDKSNRILDEVFSEVGKSHGYEYGSVSAVYSATRDICVKWERNPFYAKFKVSDYLSYADRDTLREFAERMFARMEYNNVPYGDKVRRYVLSDAFIDRVQPLYIKRSKGFKDMEGMEDKLRRTVIGLVDRGIIKGDTGIGFFWTNERMKNAGYCACLPKIVAISSELNCDECPDYVLGYLVYHYVTMVRTGREIFGTDKDLDLMVEDAESGYEGKDAAVRWIRAMGLYL